MRYIYLLCVFIFFSCKKNKNNPILREKIHLDNTVEHLEKLNCSTLNYEKSSGIQRKKHSNVHIYKKFNIELKHFLDESKNIAGEILKVNNSVVDSIISDSYVKVPYLYNCFDNFSILFVEESDEGGVWGQKVYLLKENENKILGDINISPIEDYKEFHDDFISIINDNNKIEIKINDSLYFDTRTYKTRSAHSFSRTFNLN